jgi:hypothetical protein
LKEANAANGAWRVVVSNPTGHTCTVQVCTKILLPFPATSKWKL